MTADTLYAYVGRQAIFDRRLRVVGYELLYRDSEENRARFADANEATAVTMLTAFAELGLDRLVGPLPVYINLPVDFLLGRFPIPLPPERTYLEVLEDVPVTPALVDALRSFRERGFRIALDDFVLSDRTAALVGVADVVKIDVLGAAADDVAARYAALRPSCGQLLAEKISEHEELARLRALGFDLFQGHFLERPIVARARRLPHNRAALLQILTRLYDARVDLREIESLISADVGLAMRLLRLASSVAMKGSAPIGSLAQAIGRLGTELFAALVVVALASGFDDKPFELARQALVRARMCEGLARSYALPPEQMFTAGLLSLVDALLDLPRAELLAQLEVTPLIRTALDGDPTTEPAARVLEAVRGQDRADFVRVEATGIPAAAVFVAWFEAIRWADALIARM